MHEDRPRVLFMLSYMRGGNTGPWADQRLDQIQRGDTFNPPIFPFPSYAAFIDLFDLRFAEKDEAEKARHAIRLLKQGGKTCDNFIANFKTLEPLTGYNDEALVEMFKQGLNPVLVDKIFFMENMPTNLAGWKRIASRFDRQFRQRQEE